MATPAHYRALREALAALPADVSNDAHGAYAPKLEDIYAPEAHAAALSPTSVIVQGARGAGKSFWAGVLGQPELRAAAATAYPRLGLDALEVQFGFTGLGGPEGIDRARLDELVPDGAQPADARLFWWATILRAIDRVTGRATNPEGPRRPLRDYLAQAADVEARDRTITDAATLLTQRGTTLVVVFDALDAAANTWPRRRLLLGALFEVVWALRAWRSIRPKVFLRPDQLDDDALQFVELPKLRSGAVRLTWTGTDLYGLLFARLALGEARASLKALLQPLGVDVPERVEIVSRRWPLVHDASLQKRVMVTLAGPYMGANYKKGHTYEWPITHLADAFDEVTPRSFLGLAIGAATHGQPPPDKVLTPDGIRHGLRLASTTRVDQLHQELPWIKGVLAPLDGLLLPQTDAGVVEAWKRAGTVAAVEASVAANGYLSPFPENTLISEPGLFQALARIGVMMRRKDGRIDMPDLFRVAARLLKKGGTAPA